MLPALAYMALIPLDMALGPERQPLDYAVPLILALRCLASGFILTSLLWASALAAVLDRQMFRAAAYLGVAAVCSLVGIIHSPLAPAVIGWPWECLLRHAAAIAGSPLPIALSLGKRVRACRRGGHADRLGIAASGWAERGLQEK